MSRPTKAQRELLTDLAQHGAMLEYRRASGGETVGSWAFLVNGKEMRPRPANRVVRRLSGENWIKACDPFTSYGTVGRSISETGRAVLNRAGAMGQKQAQS